MDGIDGIDGIDGRDDRFDTTGRTRCFEIMDQASWTNKKWTREKRTLGSIVVPRLKRGNFD